MAKGLQRVKVFSCTVPEKPKKLDRIGAMKEGPFGIFQHPFCRKILKKLKGDTLGTFFFEKSLTMSKKLKEGP